HTNNYLCFSAAQNANAPIPGVSVTSDGMVVSYQYATQTYQAGCGESVLTAPSFVYRVNPTASTCGIGNYVSMKLVPLDSNHKIDMQLKKCDGSPFVQGGRYEIWIDLNGDGQITSSTYDKKIDSGTYSAGVTTVSDYIYPVLWGYYG